MKHPLPPFEFRATPHQTKRVVPVEVIVIHHSANESTESVVNWFQDPKSERSAHYVVSRDGSLTQMVLPEMAAWHCRGANQYSVGIEVVALNRPMQTAQDIALRKLVAHLLERFRLDYRRVTGHKYEGHTPTECPGKLFDPWGNVFKWAKECFRAEFPVRIA